MKEKNSKPEILAPVGGKEQLLAAIRCGADAVYFGLQNFNARRNADNFAGEELRQTIEYCHERYVKVFITINTLVKDSELDEVYKAVDTACENGADGLIVQDLAVMAYAREHWPGVSLVASTQMAVHNLAGTKTLKAMGFDRAVLARELTLAEVKKIAESCDLELEAFVHGAHCMSVSGLCYLSSIIGGRSGNRGLCAQPCRLDCSSCGRDYALSLKDLSYITHIKELADAGVSSFKIEGRMKRPEYVAAAVTACKAAIDGSAPDMKALEAVFSRSGFTDGYLTGSRNTEMFGHRTKEDVVAAKDVLSDLSGLYEKEPQSIPVDMFLKIREGSPSVLSVTDGNISVETSGAEAEPARTIAIDEAYAQKSLSKTGGTPYYLRNLKLFADDGLTLPAAALNELRRNAISELGKKRVEAFENKKAAAGPRETTQLSAEPGSCDNELWARFENPSQLFSDCPKTVIIPAKHLCNPDEVTRIKSFGVERIIAELPSVVWPGDEEGIFELILKLKEVNINEVYVENIGLIDFCRSNGFAVHGGMFLNILNSKSIDEHLALGLEDACLSFENRMEDIKNNLAGDKTGMVVYGYLPLMKFRACPARGENGCGGCKGISSLKDRKGEKFAIICRDKRYSELLNSVPLYIGDRKRPEQKYELLYFTTETADEATDVTRAYQNGESFAGRKTAGLYYRELL